MPSRRRGGIDPLQLTPGDYVVHEQHGVGRYLEMTSRTVQGATREYLVIEYAPGKRGQPPDRLYLPTDQLDEVTRYVGGEAPSLHRLGGADWAKTKGRARKAVREIAAELIRLYSARMASPGHAFGPDTPVAARAGGRFPLRGDAGPARRHRRGQAGHGAARPDGPADLRRRRLRQDRDRGARGVQGRAGRQAGRRARADHAAGPAAHCDVRRALCAVPGRRSGRCRGSRATPRSPRRCRPRRRHRRRGDRHAPAAVARRPGSSPARPRDHRRGAALRGRAQGVPEAAAHPGRRAVPCRPPRSRARWRWAWPGSGRCPRSSPRPRSATRC